MWDVRKGVLWCVCGCVCKAREVRRGKIIMSTKNRRRRRSWQAVGEECTGRVEAISEERIVCRKKREKKSETRREGIGDTRWWW